MNESQINRSLTQKAEKKKEIELKENSKVTRSIERGKTVEEGNYKLKRKDT